LAASGRRQQRPTVFSFQGPTEIDGRYANDTNLATTNWSYYTNLPRNGSLLQLIAPLPGIPRQFFFVSKALSLCDEDFHASLPALL
jgi:hypothetical protein